MSFASPIAEQTLKNTSRLFHQSMWLLLPISFGLMMVLRRGNSGRTGSLWFLGCAILAFMLSFALRDVVRKVGRRNTEDKLVNDVKTFLAAQPAEPAVRPAPARAAVSPAPVPASTPARPADFVALKGAAPYRTPAGDPVVFEAFPPRESVAVKIDFYAVLQPVSHSCPV